ncbi:drug/metabolite transporter (DMT)-like permease [Friedmanniella endophytica]|uniref:Drug/metabolite transporter (DMT)-like permease n=1 Tax=Microlunatus kandeliicorticis TaxID=1759536 RepID=A0A7W3P4I7_9ACTN|nr:DMT family transporter [Microlunatus kandeliicorticis]MBA8792944.1 drug/metabolite transporter (DMT)-like permease [Microlunatus kandeliicorticis]
MSGFLTSPLAPVLAALLAAVGSIVFGLAAVRQHGAVQDATADERAGRRHWWRQVTAVLRDRSWLVGAAQATAGGGLHVVALALAPITLVQPIGVLAVPTTVIAAAARQHRRPPRSQLIGMVLAVAGIVVVTVVLLLPGSTRPLVPAAGAVALAVAVLVVPSLLVLLLARRLPPLARTLALAVAAAALFGLNSVMIRIGTALLADHTFAARWPTTVLAVVGLVVGLPLGLLCMQAAYRSGSAHAVICCLTLFDPVSAVTGGRLLLHDGGGLAGWIVAAAAVGAVLTVVGVLVLSREYPVEVGR